MPNLDKFFSPRSVAVIGASRNPRKPGHVIFRNFIEGSFRGKVYPINPNADEILGHRAYPTVLSVKGRIDLAVIAVPAPLVPPILRQCGKKRVKHAIIISGGFRETGNEELENECIEIARKHKMRIIGPNCVGVYDPYTGTDTFFFPRFKLERPSAGSISLVSQSGALGSVMLDWMAMKNYRIAKFISYGNASDINESDIIEYLSSDRKTKVICLYLEGAKDGRRLYETIKKATRKKPVIAIKAGKTDDGKLSVRSHTGSLAGSPEIYSAAFRQAGTIEAETPEELFDFARVLSTQPKPKGRHVQIITNGGGLGVLAADSLSRNNLLLSRMSSRTLAKLESKMPKQVVIGNPTDLTGDATTERYADALAAAMSDPYVDMVMMICLFQLPSLTADIVETITEFGKRRKKPLVLVSAGGRFSEVLKKPIEDHGIPTFSYPDAAAKALKALYEYHNSD